MSWVEDDAKWAALVDRGATTLLAALEVGPHIKPIREATGVPYQWLVNASWYLRRAGIWKAKTVEYRWLSAYHQGLASGVDGLTEDACLAAGIGSDGLIWSAQRDGRHKSWTGWKATTVPPCGSVVALSRHRRKGEECQSCDAFAEQRRASWLERKSRIQEQRAQWLAAREEASKVAMADWEALLEGGDARTLSVFAPYSLDAPYAFGDGTTSRYEKVSNLEKHLIEWDNPVHDEAESDIEDWERLQEITESVDGRRSR